ncbi:MAG: hypothetical protein ACKO9V_11125 [Candidatus Kapaibacterium sp.]
MSFTTRQRQIITRLTEQGSMTVVEFLLGIATETHEADARQWQDVVVAAPGRFHMFIPQWNNRSAWLLFGVGADAHVEVLEFFTLMRDLHARKLVTIITDPKRHVRASAIAGATGTSVVVDADRAALEIDALLQTPSELLGLAISSERIYALPALHDLKARNFVVSEELLVSRQRELLQTQQRTLSRMIPLLVIAVTGCLLVSVAGFLMYRSANLRSTVTSPMPTAPATVPAQVIIRRDTVVIRDTVVRKTPAPRKARKLWYME